jgi:hypothetical protein
MELVGAVGIEPTTFGLKGRCSTTELRPYALATFYMEESEHAASTCVEPRPILAVAHWVSGGQERLLTLVGRIGAARLGDLEMPGIINQELQSPLLLLPVGFHALAGNRKMAGRQAEAG